MIPIPNGYVELKQGDAFQKGDQYWHDKKSKWMPRLKISGFYKTNSNHCTTIRPIKGATLPPPPTGYKYVVKGEEIVKGDRWYDIYDRKLIGETLLTGAYPDNLGWSKLVRAIPVQKSFPRYFVYPNSNKEAYCRFDSETEAVWVMKDGSQINNDSSKNNGKGYGWTLKMMTDKNYGIKEITAEEAAKLVIQTNQAKEKDNMRIAIATPNIHVFNAVKAFLQEQKVTFNGAWDYWSCYKKLTCISVSDNKRPSYGDRAFYEANGYTIYSINDLETVAACLNQTNIRVGTTVTCIDSGLKGAGWALNKVFKVARVEEYNKNSPRVLWPETGSGVYSDSVRVSTTDEILRDISRSIKPGDYVVALPKNQWTNTPEKLSSGHQSGGGGYKEGQIYRVKEVNEATWVMWPTGGGSGVYVFALRKATDSEIQKFNGSTLVVGKHTLKYQPEHNRLLVDNDVVSIEDLKKLKAHLGIRISGYPVYVNPQNISIGCKTIQQADLAKVFELVKI